MNQTDVYGEGVIPDQLTLALTVCIVTFFFIQNHVIQTHSKTQRTIW